MAITGTFLADFSSFYRAVQDAQASLRSFEGDTKRVTDSLSRMTDSFSGRKVISEASLMVKAIENIGGPARLTEAELQRVGRSAEEALAKMKALGIEAPPELLKLADAAKKVPPEIDKMNKSSADASKGWKDFGTTIQQIDITNPIQSAQSQLTKLAQSFLMMGGGAGTAVAAGLVVAGSLAVVTKQAADAGDEFGDLADKTGMSVEALSRMSNALAVSGGDMGTMTDALFKLQKSMGEDPDKVAKGLERIGLSFDEFKAAGPDKYIELLAQAFAETEDPAQRAAAAAEIFKDKTGSLIPVLRDVAAGLDMTSDIDPFTKEQADQAEAFNRELASISVHAKAVAMSIGKDLLPYALEFVKLLEAYAPTLALWVARISGLKFVFDTLAGSINVARTAWEYYAAASRMAKGESDGVEDALNKVKMPAQQLATVTLPGLAGVMAKDLTKGMELAESASKALTAATNQSIDAHQRSAAAKKAAAEAEKKAAEEAEKQLEKTLKGMDAFENESVKAAQAIGVYVTPALRTLGVQMGTIALGQGKQMIGFMQLLGDTSVQAAAHMRELQTETNSFSGAMTKFFSGDLSGGFRMLGASVREALNPTKILSGALSDLVSGGLSTLLNFASKGVTSIFKKLFGDPEKEVNPIREAFVQMHGGLMNLNADAERAGISLKRMLDAKNVKDYKAAIDELNAALQFQEDAMAELDAVVKKYGLSIEQLGPAFAQQQLDKQAMELFHDFELLILAAKDQDTAIQAMSKSLMDYVAKSIAAGTTVPEAMRPIIQRMLELGMFTREDGTAITTLEELGIHFSDTVSDKFKDLIAAIEKLTEAIKRGLTEPLAQATTQAQHFGGAMANIAALAAQEYKIRVVWDVQGAPPPPGPPGAPPAPPPAAFSGGIVGVSGLAPYLAGGGTVGGYPGYWGPSKGTDTVPAWLTPGEIVLNAKQQRMLFEGKTAAAPPVTVHTYVYVERDGTASVMTDQASFNRRVQEAMRSGSVVVPSSVVMDQT